MFFVLEFFIYLIYNSFWIYSLLEQTVLYTSQGGKIGKYIKKYNLKNISSNYESLDVKKFICFLKSPQGSKCLKYSLIATTVILAIKIAFSIDFLFSDYFYITIFDKNINLSNFFESKYILFKIFYFVIFYIFYQVNSFKIIRKKVCKNVKNSFNEIADVDMAVIGEENGNKIGIERNGLYQNVLITGSIGSGKTSTVITNILDYIILNNIPGLILDVKGNFINTVKKVISENNSNFDLRVITDKSGEYNPIDIPYLSAYELAERIKKTLEILSEKSSSDSYWLDKAQSYIKDFIVLIRNYKEFVSFDEIHKLCLDNEYLNLKIDEVKKNVLTKIIPDAEIFEITNSISNLKKEYMTLDDRTKNIIRSEITRMTDLFVSSFDVCNNFCLKNKDYSFFSGITVVSMNIGENPKLAKAIATYVKLNFQSQVLKNDNNKDKFMLCDEYQEFVNKEDAHFFSLSREYKCINVVAMQSYSSLKNTLGSEDASKVIIQNFVNKIWLRNDDVYTVEEITKQLGKELKQKTNISLSENSQDSKYNIFTKNFKNYKSGITESYTITEDLQMLLDISYFTSRLKTFEAVCLLSNGIEYVIYKKVKLKMWKEGKKYEK